MQKPRIIVFTTAYAPLVGGVEVAIEEILKRYKDRFDFFIITSRFHRKYPRRETREEGLAVRVGLGLKFDKWLLPFLGFWWGAMRIVWRRPTVLWAMDISQGAVAALFLKILFPRTPLIFTVQYGEDTARLRHGRGGAIGYIFRALLRHADYVTAISAYLLDLSRVFGYLGPAKLIHNGVDFLRFHPGENNGIEKKRGKTIITVSRLVQKNGVDILIRAIAEVKKTVPDIKCVVIGDGPERRILEALVESLELREHVLFFGTVSNSEIYPHLRNADIFVRPSRSEGMGNSFVEALAAGIPIIGTAVGGIPDIIENEKTGLFIETENPSDCARKIIRLLYDDELSRKIAAEGSALVERSFSWDRIGAMYAEVFSHFFSAKSRLLVVTGLFPPEIGGPATYSKLLRDELLSYGVIPAVLHFGSVRHLPKGIRHAVFFGRIFCAMRGRDVLYAQDPLSVGFPARIAALIMGKVFFLKIVGDYAWEQAVQRFGVNDILDDFVQKKYGWRVELFRHIERFVAHGAKKIVVPSNYLKNIVIQWGINTSIIEVIYNAREENYSFVSRESARNAMGLFGTALISVGRLVPWKGFMTLVELLPLLSKKIPDVTLFIAGQGPLMEEISFRARALGITGRLRLLGALSQKNLSLLLRGGDIFLLNTAYEGFSHTLLEAMAEEIPVVTTIAGGNPELIEQGASGLLVNYNDTKAFEGAILRIAEDSVLRKKLIQGGRMRAHLFTKEKMLGETASLILKL